MYFRTLEIMNNSTTDGLQKELINKLDRWLITRSPQTYKKLKAERFATYADISYESSLFILYEATKFNLFRDRYDIKVRYNPQETYIKSFYDFDEFEKLKSIYDPYNDKEIKLDMTNDISISFELLEQPIKQVSSKSLKKASGADKIAIPTNQLKIASKVRNCKTIAEIFDK